MMLEFWTASRTQNLTSAGVIAALAWIGCYFAAKYELALLGRNPSQSYWPPRQWPTVQIWRAIRGVDAPPARLMWWGIMLWIYWIMMLILFPFVLYVTYLSLVK